MPDHLTQLERLHARFDAIASRREPDGNSVAAHAAILARLATGRRDAEAAGWSACALERDGGMGRLRLVGVPPGEGARREFPDAAF
jgi:hypothetical protein